MDIHLTPEPEQLISNQIKSGRYHSANDVVREALRLLEQRDEMFPLQKEELRQQIEDGWQAAQRGDFVDGDKVFNRIDAELKALEQSTLK